MMNFKNSVILLVMSTLFSGCAATAPKLPKISESEAFKYEKEYLAEYELWKKDFTDSVNIKWIQPSNKKELCKVYVGVDKNNDITMDENYKIFWDGECKDGYAYGLGREFERGTVLNRDALAIYSGKKEEPQYFIEKYNLDNRVIEGDINNRYYVETTITDEISNFKIIYMFGFMGSESQPCRLLICSSPFEDNLIFLKTYPNFAYKLYDASNNEFEQSKYKFQMLDKNGIENGFSFITSKRGERKDGELINGKFVRWVLLPESYLNHVTKIINEIKEAARKAKNARKVALRVKKQYMNKICRDSVQVDFIDNDEYKSICNEGLNHDLKEKIENKFSQINLQKQQYREQLNRQKEIDAQVAQANAAQYQARAQSWQAINSQLQGLTQSLQQTNSYSWPSMPTSTTTYQPYNSNTRKIKNCYTAGGIEFCN